MGKSKTLLFAGLVGLSATLTAQAQTPLPGMPAVKIEKALKQGSAQNPSQLAMMKKKYPLLFQHKMLNTGTLNNGIREVKRFALPRKKPAVKKSALMAEGVSLPMYVNLLGESFSGIYSVTPPSSLAPEQLAAYGSGFFNGGCGIVDNKLTGIYYDTSFAGWGIILEYNYSFDMDTWEVSDRKSLEDYSLMATETAQDPKTGEIFGQFYKSDLSGLEYGVIDYNTLTRTTIGTANTTMAAIGITNDGSAYGIGADGNLYKIDRTDGTETLIGSTGITLTDSEGAFYFQTGEVNPRTNEFYWYSMDADGTGQLYIVNLETAALTPVGAYSGEYANASTVGMMIPNAPAEDLAPAAAENLAANFEGSSLSGNVTFTAPTKTYDGTSDLSGSLDYEVVVNRTDTVKGTTTPGASVSVPVTAQKEGMLSLAVRTKNDVGYSPFVRTSHYVGYDKPVAPTNVKFEMGEGNKATVTWTAPTATVNGGYLGDLTYDVCRISATDTVKVASDLRATTFTETLPEGPMASYTYGVVAKNLSKASDMALSNGLVVGQAIEVPFFDDFLTDINLYTVIDANGDGSTWSWFKGAARYKYNSSNDADDWLITPPIHLQAGKRYDVSFKASANGSSFPERIEAKYGMGNTVEAMTNELAPSTDLTSSKYVQFAKTITAETDGNYYFGFHAISDKDEFYLYVDSVSIDIAPELTAPDSVTNLKAVADPTAALKATVSFTAPSKSIEGKALSTLSSIEVRNGNNVIKTLTDVAPGKEYSVVDETARQGTNAYTVVASNESGRGLKRMVSVYVGQDIPTAPEVSAADHQTSVHLSWLDVDGANGGVVIPDSVTYTIFDVDGDGYIGDALGSVKGENDYDVTYNTTEGDAQNLKMWAVQAATSAGAGSASAASVITGRPYILPFHNSFRNASLEDQFLGIYRSSAAYKWYMLNDSYDGDAGCLGFTSSEVASGYVFTGKISLAGAVNPKLMFFFKSPANLPVTLSVAPQLSDGTTLNPVFTKDLSANADTEWQRVLVDLPASLIDQPYVVLQFQTSASEAMTSDTYLLLDNINVFDPDQKDAGVEVTAPESVKKGQTADLGVKVTNQGLEDINNAHVTLKVNGTTVLDKTIDRKLATLESETIHVAYRTTTLDESSSLNVTAQLADEDDNADNNTATAVVQAISADVEAPNSLTAEGSTPVVLNWKAPESSSAQVTDDFESYEPWSLSYGDWTTIDADGGLAGGLNQSMSYTHQGEQFAFLCWQPSDMFQSGQGLDPHSGTKALAGIYQVDETGQNFVDADNWLITPRLSGKAQTITFWVNNAVGDGYGTETFQVLTSSTNNSQESFTKLGDDYTQGSGTWTEISVNVPEGTNYLAVRQITSADNAFIFMLDDVTYETSSAPVAYNVYRDGALLGQATGLTYTDNTAEVSDATYTYQVTAVYTDGSESAPISTTIVTTIQGLENSGVKNFDVYTLDGIQLLKDAKSLKGIKEGVYIINGVKTVIRK